MPKISLVVLPMPESLRGEPNDLAVACEVAWVKEPVEGLRLWIPAGNWLRAFYSSLPEGADRPSFPDVLNQAAGTNRWLIDGIEAVAIALREDEPLLRWEKRGWIFDSGPSIIVSAFTLEEESASLGQEREWLAALRGRGNG